MRFSSINFLNKILYTYSIHVHMLLPHSISRERQSRLLYGCIIIYLQIDNLGSRVHLHCRSWKTRKLSSDSLFGPQSPNLDYV